MPDEAASITRHLGLDLGGTNIHWVVADRSVDGGRPDDWHVLDRDEEPTLSHEGPDAVIARLADVARRASARWPGVASVGVGVPGLYDPAAGTVRHLPNLPGDWHDKPLAGIVGDALGLPCHLVNDARAFGLAELRLGAGRGAPTMVGLTLGTGVGGVLAINGHINYGHDGTAGEFGHQTIDPDGPLCGCGNHGCLEAFVRADAIARACSATTAEEAFERALAGDQRAQDGMTQVGRYLGIGIGNLIVGLTPDLVVIGGGVAGALELLNVAIQAELRERVRVTSLEAVSIVPAQLGIWAGSIGAAVHGAEMADV